MSTKDQVIVKVARSPDGQRASRSREAPVASPWAQRGGKTENYGPQVDSQGSENAEHPKVPALQLSDPQATPIDARLSSLEWIHSWELAGN